MNIAIAAHHLAHHAVHHHLAGPRIDWSAFSPLVVLAAGGLVVLLAGLLRTAFVRERLIPLLTIATLACAIAFEIVRLHHPATIISGALRIDDLALELDMLLSGAAIATVIMSLRTTAPRESGHGEYHSLLLFSVLGMAVLVSAQNLITLFIAIELLSIPLYVLCASEHRREGSLEAGLKYLVIGSVGSATLVYGLALVYGATGATEFAPIAAALSQGRLAGGALGDPMLLTGLGLVIVGFAFKASVAPFHQWTPDVYEGAPTPITAFMSTATKAAALGVFLRFFDVAAIGAQNTWAPVLAAIAAITILVGNAGALGQSSLKRMLGYSGVAQAGYMLSGVVVGSRLGIQATALHLLAYLGMNLAPFAVLVACERERPELGDDISTLAGLGARNPWLAWPMTVGMLALAGIPGTVGFIGKFQLIHALVDGAYTWLAIVLVVGSMISLGYYLRVVATMWMRPAPTMRPEPAPGGGALAPIAGGSAELDDTGDDAGAGGAAEDDLGGGRDAARSGDGDAGAAGAAEDDSGGRDTARGRVGDAGTGDGVEDDSGGGRDAARGGVSGALRRGPAELALLALVLAAAVVFFGIVPSPLFHFAAHAGRAIPGLF